MAEIDVSTLRRRERHALMVGTVIPRPIGFVSTVDAEGRRNLAPFAYFNVFSSTPPILGLGIARRRRPDRSFVPLDTLANILETKEFVVNFVSEEFAEGMVATSAEVGPDVDEFEVGGFTAAPGTRVNAPRVAESPVAWECVLYDTVEFRRSKANPDAPVDDETFTTLVLGEVTHVHVADEYMDPETGRVDWRKLRPVARLGGVGYWRRGDVFEIPRPEATELENAG